MGDYEIFRLGPRTRGINALKRRRPARSEAKHRAQRASTALCAPKLGVGGFRFTGFFEAGAAGEDTGDTGPIERFLAVGHS